MAFSFLADIELESVYTLTPQWLLDRGIRLLLLDFDNTIIAYTVKEPTEQFLTWWKNMEENGVRLMVVSNSRKSRRVPDFCQPIGLPFIRHAGKPNPKGILRAMEQMGFSPNETAMAGDQTFTDILGGNLAGVTSILVRPIYFSNPFQKIRFAAEQPFIHLGRRKRKRSSK